MGGSLQLKVEFVQWFETTYPGEQYKIRSGRCGELVIIRENGTLIAFSEYYAQQMGNIIGGPEGEQH